LARLTAAVAALVVSAGWLAGCSGSGGGAPGPNKPGELRILAGSELSDIEPLLGDLQKATGVKVTLSYAGTLDGADQIVRHATKSDAAWFASDRYLRLLPGGAAATVQRTTIMNSPVVLGVRTALATKFGWTGGARVTWADIAAKVGSGELTYAMTNPAASNSGFSALVGVAAALAGTADALQASDIRPAALTSFFSGQVLSAGSSGWLAEAFGNQRDTVVGGMINYESVLLSLQRSGRLREPLTLVYPQDGIITADYPMLLLDPGKRDEYTRVVGWLRSPEVQRRLQTETNRRPAVPGVPLDPRFARAPLVELPFPATRQVADQLLAAYLDRFRRPSHAIFILDVSGSMAGARLSALQATLKGLAGADDSLAGRFARFRGREKITLLTFSNTVHDERTFTVNDPKPGSADLTAISSYVDTLRANGGTAIYSALSQAYATIVGPHRDPNYLTSIVLMTDGENNAGLSAADFSALYQRLPADIRGVRTFPVVFGEADQGAMEKISHETGGALFDARSVSLSQAFKEIRGYQ
jgi:Ca-activated chloride channel family protein